MGSFGENVSIVLSWNFNIPVGNEVVENVIGRHGVPGWNENLKNVTVVTVSWLMRVNLGVYVLITKNFHSFKEYKISKSYW